MLIQVLTNLIYFKIWFEAERELCITNIGKMIYTVILHSFLQTKGEQSDLNGLNIEPYIT